MTTLQSKKTVYVCTNKRVSMSSPSCGIRGSEEIMELVKQELQARGVTCPVEPIQCLGQCTFGPNFRIAPGGEFFHEATKDKINEIADWVELEIKK